MFYVFDQNNSYGYFEETDTLCHRLFIEAGSKQEAIDKAEELGCYWDGVLRGIDCPCCGDRWSNYCEDVPLLDYMTDGYKVSIPDGIYKDTVGEWNKRYGRYGIVVPPKYENASWGSRNYVGSIRFNSIEEYAQYLANEFGHWTKPDGRIFYEDGTVKEIFSQERSDHNV